MSARSQDSVGRAGRHLRADIRVEIANTQGHLQVDPSALSGLVNRTLRGQDVRVAQVSVALVDDATIRKINRDYLGHDWPTDVISFLLSEPGSPELVGELVVSAEMARTTAVSIGADPAMELALYIVHGLLHLCGYNDGTEAEIERMREREDEILRREGIANTYSFPTEHDHCREAGERAPCSD